MFHKHTFFGPFQELLEQFSNSYHGPCFADGNVQTSNPNHQQTKGAAPTSFGYVRPRPIEAQRLPKGKDTK